MELIQKQCLYGTFVLFNNDIICHMMLNVGYFAKFEIEFFRSFLKENDNVIEIGAFIGTHAIPIKQMIKNGKLICFEPQQHIFKILCTNLILNNCADVIALPYGIGIEKVIQTNLCLKDVSRFSLLKNSSNNPEKNSIISVKSIKNFSDFYNTFNHLKLIKIDVEGMDLEVLNDIRDLIIHFRPFIFIEYEENTIEKIKKFFDDLNYDCFYFNTSLYQYYPPNTILKVDKYNESMQIDDIRIKNFGDYNLFIIPKEISKKPNLISANIIKMLDAKKIDKLEDIDLHWFD